MKMHALIVMLFLAGAIFAFSGDSGSSNSGSGNSGGSSDDSAGETDDSGRDSAEDLLETDDSGRDSAEDMMETRDSGMDSSNDLNDDKGGMRRFMLNDRELPCGNETTMRERVKCRMDSDDDDDDDSGRARLYYVPEECRALTDDSEVRECLALYDNVQECRDLDGHDNRFACVREKLSIRAAAMQAKQQCYANGVTAQTCLTDLREKYYNLAKFRIYNLENVVEKWMNAGFVDAETGQAFIATLEAKKLEFNDAQTVEGKKEVLLQTVQLWKQFVKDVRSKNGRGSDDNSGRGSTNSGRGSDNSSSDDSN